MFLIPISNANSHEPGKCLFHSFKHSGHLLSTLDFASTSWVKWHSSSSFPFSSILDTVGFTKHSSEILEDFCLGMWVPENIRYKKQVEKTLFLTQIWKKCLHYIKEKLKLMHHVCPIFNWVYNAWKKTNSQASTQRFDRNNEPFLLRTSDFVRIINTVVTENQRIKTNICKRVRDTTKKLQGSKMPI